MRRYGGDDAAASAHREDWSAGGHAPGFQPAPTLHGHARPRYGRVSLVLFSVRLLIEFGLCMCMCVCVCVCGTGAMTTAEAMITTPLRPLSSKTTPTKCSSARSAATSPPQLATAAPAAVASPSAPSGTTTSPATLRPRRRQPNPAAPAAAAAAAAPTTWPACARSCPSRSGWTRSSLWPWRRCRPGDVPVAASTTAPRGTATSPTTLRPRRRIRSMRRGPLQFVGVPAAAGVVAVG